MATYENGVNGNFRGKVGSVIGSKWKGLNYIKGISNKKKTDTPTEAQVNQREKIRLVGKFLHIMNPVVSLGFNQKENTTAYNEATAYLFKNALNKSTSPCSIRYDRVLLTRGEYPNDDNLKATAGPSGTVVFTWDDITGVGAAAATDQVVLVAYCPARQQMSYISVGIARCDRTAMLDVSLFKGQTVETYLSFRSKDGTEISSGVYTGQVTVTA
jgi:hypothetical protein